MVDGMRPTICPPMARSRQTRIPKSAAAWMFDPCPLGAALTVALAPVKLGRTLLLIIRRLGADDVKARRGRGSEEFGPLDAMPQHQQGTDPPSSPRMPQPRHDANSRSNATCGGFVSEDCTFGLDVAASLDRRRTSIVNDGTARLNVVLDTAYGSANSFRPRRLCEAMHSKAIADYCGGEQPVVSAVPRGGSALGAMVGAYRDAGSAAPAATVIRRPNFAPS